MVGAVAPNSNDGTRRLGRGGNRWHHRALKLPRPLEESTRLALGETLETDAVSKASVFVAEIGRLEVEPMTRLRLLQSGAGRKRIALDRGTIHATIWAPPGQFVVDTPSAVAVDLGCMYTLHVDDAGSGILRTTLGWVGFHRNGRESFIPAGAACPTNAQVRPRNAVLRRRLRYFPLRTRPA